MKRLLLLLMILGLFTACKPREVLVTQYDTIYQNTVTIETVRDTIIDIQIETQFIDKFTDDTISELSTDNAFSRALIIGGTLYHSLMQYGQIQAEIEYKDVYHYDTIYKSKIEEKIKQVPRKRTWIEKFFILMGIISTVAISTYIVIKLRKFVVR